MELGPWTGHTHHQQPGLHNQTKREYTKGTNTHTKRHHGTNFPNAWDTACVSSTCEEPLAFHFGAHVNRQEQPHNSLVAAVLSTYFSTCVRGAAVQRSTLHAQVEVGSLDVGPSTYSVH